MQDIRGEILCGTLYIIRLLLCDLNSHGPVSQFTLLASTKKGSKPDFHGAVGGEQAKVLYQRFVSQIQQGYDPEKVQDGVFQAMMVCTYSGQRYMLTDVKSRRLLW